MLKPWRKGETGRVSNVASRYVETQQYARENSMKALRTLVERLDDPDGRIAVVAANSILERAWGKVREQKPEEQQQARIDLSHLSAAELTYLGHREPKHTVHYTRTAAVRFEGLWR